MHLKCHFSLLSFRFYFLYIWSTLHKVLPLFVTSSFFPTFKMSSDWQIHSEVLWMLFYFFPIEQFSWWVALNGNLYICICQINMQMWLNQNAFLLSSFSLRYPGLASMSFRYHAHITFGNISLIAWSLCINLIGVWFILAGSKHFSIQVWDQYKASDL